MKNRRAILWLIIAIVALVVAHVMVTWYGGDDVRIVRRSTLLDPSAKIAKISIASNDQPIVSLAMEDQWRIVYPYSASADVPQVRRLLDALAYTPIDSHMTDLELMRLGRSHADFDLDRPRLAVTLSGEEKTSRICFGTDMPGKVGVYAMIDGEQSVYCITNSVIGSLNIGADGFRQRSLFPEGMEAVTSFEIKRGHSVPLAFVADGEGWTVGSSKASTQKVKTFLSTLLNAKAMQFVWPTGSTNEPSTATVALLSGYGLEPESAVSVTLKLVGGKERRVMIGKMAGEGLAYVLAQNAGAIVTVPMALRELAVQDAVAYTDSRLFPIEESAVISFTLSTNGMNCVVARGEGDSWRLDAPVAAAADADVVKALLGKLLSLSSIDIAASGFRVAVNTNVAPVMVATGKVLGTGRLEDLRSKDIVKIDPTVVKRVVMAQEEMPKPDSAVFDRDRGSWTVESSAKKGTVIVHNVESILKALNPLRAERVESLRDNSAELGRFGLDKPYLTLSIDLDREDSVRKNIIIGAQVEGGRYATVGASDAIFVISQATVDLLESAIVE